MDKIAIVILNYNGRHFLEKFLPSVIQYSPPNSVIVADNASKDGSILFLETNFPQIRRIKLTENYGFAKGYNEALKQVNAKYYVLLNSDVEVTPNWIEPILDFLEKNPQVAAGQPKIKAYHQESYFEHAGGGGGFIDKFGYPFCRGRVFDTLEEDTGQYDDTKQVFWATGACLFVRSTIYHALGGLDDDFFAHMEEIDLCWRMQQQGYEVWYVGESQVFHVGGGTLQKTNPFKTFLNFRNNLAMLYKNLPAHQIFYVLFVRFFLDSLAALFFIKKGFFKDAWAVVCAYWAFYIKIVYWHRKRKKIPKNLKNKLIYPKSIVWQYFILKNKVFKDLKY